ncbi:transcriptional repressor LexA [Magnetospira sp. QH-2]|uniref:transcriptional repressor LexA n=1 Tax=Magnetospira sp. (strain QH-2) TaxID=1288970 RepID=UPI0003E819F2|nr:transcriptional repressor LexA [Magnetospira sp. QH-2]CCQ73966.1 SOS response transcriptional repressor, LexA [Magnetospira sp. QH-2]
MLTKKQYELLTFIDARLRESGVSPSYDEMKDALGLASKSGIHRLITGLEERGFIRRLPHRARALEVVKLPENIDDALPPAPAKTRDAFAPNVIQADFRILGSEPARPSDDTVRLPLYGRIAAGTPIEALRDPGSAVEVPAGLLAQGRGDHYTLEVDGDSMIEAGILDGDTVIIQQCSAADTGEIVVALVENQEVTLKRLRKKGHSVALEPANARYETRIYGPDQVQIQGRLVGLLRQY